MRWGMTIDLGRCTGCYGCVLACKQEHSTPTGIHFRRMMFEEVGQYPAARRLHAPGAQPRQLHGSLMSGKSLHRPIKRC